MPTPSVPRPTRGSSWHLLALCGYFLAAFVGLDHLVSKGFGWKHPQWNDQVQYLSEVYTAYSVGQSQGFWTGLKVALVNPAAQGGIHDWVGYLILSLVGPSRSAVLSVNLLFFFALQLAWVRVAQKRGWGLGGMLWAIALCWLWWTPWGLAAGSLVDFRLDFMAACAWGIALAVATSTNGFRSRAGSAWFGVALGFAVSVRFLAVTYATGVLLVFFFWILLRAERSRRLGNLGLAVGVAVAMAAPFVLPNLEHIRAYYLVGHYSGGESGIRASSLDLGHAARQVALWGWSVHVGRALAIVTALGLAGTAVRAIFRLAPRPEDREHYPVSEFWIPVAAFAVVPFGILVLHVQKSHVVESILAPSFIALGLWGWTRWSRGHTRLGWINAVVATFALLLGLTRAQAEFQRDRENTERNRELRHVVSLADSLYGEFRARKLPFVKVGVNRITDSFDAQILRLTCYERHGEWVPFLMLLPTGIAAEKDELLLDRLRECDFVFLTPPGNHPGPYPYDRQMLNLYPQVKAACEARLQIREEFSYGGKSWIFYGPPPGR